MLLGNHRVVETDLRCPLSYNRGWCYSGQGARMLAILAALAWDGSPDTEPTGWIKEITSGRCRPDGDPERETIGWPLPEPARAVAREVSARSCA
jgi:hypothetical protein